MSPEIEHIVVLMLENQSFDNILGMLSGGDGFTLDPQGSPTATNPYGSQVLRAFPMPTPCERAIEQLGCEPPVVRRRHLYGIC
jgi:phospholipase C